MRLTKDRDEAIYQEMAGTSAQEIGRQTSARFSLEEMAPPEMNCIYKCASITEKASSHTNIPRRGKRGIWTGGGLDATEAR